MKFPNLELKRFDLGGTLVWDWIRNLNLGIYFFVMTSNVFLNFKVKLSIIVQFKQNYLFYLLQRIYNLVLFVFTPYKSPFYCKKFQYCYLSSLLTFCWRHKYLSTLRSPNNGISCAHRYIFSFFFRYLWLCWIKDNKVHNYNSKLERLFKR